MVKDMVRGTKDATNAIPKRRKLTLGDAQQIANKVVNFKLNESEACYSLKIRPKQWFRFKQRHKTQGQFDAMIETIRGSQLENCVQVINRYGDGIEYTSLDKQGKVVKLTKPGDWRAKAWIAERVLAPERLGDRQPPSTVNVAVFQGHAVDNILAKVYGEPSKLQAPQQQSIDVVEVKQIPNTTTPAS